MGGKDVIYLKQQHSSSLQPAAVQKRLKDMSDKRFLDANGQYDMNNKDVYGKDKVLSYSAFCCCSFDKLLLSLWKLHDAMFPVFQIWAFNNVM